MWQWCGIMRRWWGHSEDIIFRGNLLLFVAVHGYPDEAGSSLTIVFLLLLNVAVALCMRRNISAVCIALWKRLPLLGIAWRVFSPQSVSRLTPSSRSNSRPRPWPHTMRFQLDSLQPLSQLPLMTLSSHRAVSHETLLQPGCFSPAAAAVSCCKGYFINTCKRYQMKMY